MMQIGPRQAIGPVFASSLAAAILLVRHYPSTFSTSHAAVFFACFTVQALAVSVYSILIYPEFLSPLRHVPAPPRQSLLFGHFGDIFRLPTGTLQRQWVREIPNRGLIRYHGLWNTERLLPTDAKTLQEALHANSYIFIKPPWLRSGVASVLGLKGLLFAEGDVHRHQRKILLPAFAHGHIKDLVPVFWSISRKLVQKIAETTHVSSEEPQTVTGPHGKLVNVSKWMSLATLDIIGEAGFGYFFRALDTEGNDSELAVAYATLFSMSPSANFGRLLDAFLPRWLVFSLPLARVREVKRAQATLERVARSLIARKRCDLAMEKVDIDSQRDILSVMLKSGNYDSPDSEEVIQDQLLTFLAAGHETTSTALSWAIYLLSKYPEHQTKIRDEIHSNFPSGLPENLSYAELDSLKYLRYVCDETLRVYPPVAMTMREASEDTYLGAQFVPKGTTLILCPWAINRDPALWGDDADEFRPDRWEKPGGGAESNYSFLTFLAGPRSCIGKEFSNLEMKALLVALVERFEFTNTGAEAKIKGGITARIEGGLKVWVKEVGT